MEVSRYSGSASNIYRSYLVRLWQSAEQSGWRASAQCVQTGKTFMFGSTDLLMAFLQAQLSANAPQDELGHSDDASNGH
ncbi:MAG: hypothetical protein R3A44_39950 [Caldilineaceae bacterium]